MSFPMKQSPIDQLAQIVDRHPLAVRDVLNQAGVRVASATGKIDAEALWGLLVEAAEARSRAATERADAESRRQAADENLLAKFPELARLEKLAELQPSLFPRTRRAAPEDRARALLQDYRDGLKRVAETFDEFATRETLRRWIENAFKEVGLSVRREGRSGSVFTLRREGSTAVVRVATYVVRSTKKNEKKVSFALGGVDDETSGITWIAMHARPLRRVYLVPMDEIRDRFRKRGEELPKTASYTVHQGSPDTALFENQVGHLLAEFETGNEVSSPVI